MECQVCGHDCSVSSDGVRLIRDTKKDGEELLAYLCIRCYARGIVWAAEQAKPRANVGYGSGSASGASSHGNEVRRRVAEALERRTVAAVAQPGTIDASLPPRSDPWWGKSAGADVQRTCATAVPAKSDKRQALEYDLRRILKAGEGSELDRLISVESDPVLEEALSEAHSGEFKNAHRLLGIE